jgi:probable addiction module antidote protein
VANEARSAPYDPSVYLTTPEDVQAYLNAALEDGDERVLRLALRNVAEGMGGITRLASAAGLGEDSVRLALCEDGNPRLSSLVAILKAMGLELSVRPRHDAA